MPVWKYCSRAVTTAAGSGDSRGIVLVGGGTGFVGGALVQLLRQRRFEPLIVARNPPGVLRPGVVSWKSLALDGLPKNTRAVVNLAGRTIGDPKLRWTDAFKDEVWSSRINTTSLLRDLIAEADDPPEVFVSTSAVGYYAPSETAEYTEDSEGGNDEGDFFSRLTAAWEAAARLPEIARTRLVTVRLGVVLGRSGGAVAQSFWPFFFGVGGPLGSGEQPFPWVHVDDAAGIFAHAVEAEHVRGALNAVAPQLVSNADFARAFGAALGRPAVLPMPAAAVRLLFGAERARLMLTGQRVLPRRTLDCGYRFKYATVDAAAAEFARVRLSDDERGRLRSVAKANFQIDPLARPSAKT